MDIVMDDRFCAFLDLKERKNIAQWNCERVWVEKFTFNGPVVTGMMRIHVGRESRDTEMKTCTANTLTESDRWLLLSVIMC